MRFSFLFSEIISQKHCFINENLFKSIIFEKTPLRNAKLQIESHFEENEK